MLAADTWKLTADLILIAVVAKVWLGRITMCDNTQPVEASLPANGLLQIAPKRHNNKVCDYTW